MQHLEPRCSGTIAREAAAAIAVPRRNWPGEKDVSSIHINTSAAADRVALGSSGTAPGVVRSQRASDVAGLMMQRAGRRLGVTDLRASLDRGPGVTGHRISAPGNDIEFRVRILAGHILDKVPACAIADASNWMSKAALSSTQPRYGGSNA
ncbi:hypothetical protein BC360_24980 [Ensifer sp. LC163]|nr:hypothetical protein BC360_24980 [Ensifer sp. LC163]